MKKKFLALSCIAMASMLTFGACGGGTDSSVGGTSDSSNSSGANRR
ncbi:MAG: iron ABC transporter substrate-binding protein, partial [Clostridiales bacterium]|nr:iron ABC transporter substrate-binding protein [Clostridiales bacterium]